MREWGAWTGFKPVRDVKIGETHAERRRRNLAAAILREASGNPDYPDGGVACLRGHRWLRWRLQVARWAGNRCVKSRGLVRRFWYLVYRAFGGL